MDGFLSNNWRDALALIGVALPLLQSLGLLREWISRKRTSSDTRKPNPSTVQRAWLRLGILEKSQEESESTPGEKRGVRIAIIISSVVAVACSIAFSVASPGEGCFLEGVMFLSMMLIMTIAIFHEIWLIIVIMRHLSSWVARENHGLLGAVLGLSLTMLFLLSYVASPENEGRTLSWFSVLYQLYAKAYLIAFSILFLMEVVWQVDEWQERRKKKSTQVR
jgi:hypothetical protein